MTPFSRVKEILNNRMLLWRGAPKNADDADVDLKDKHRETSFPNLDGEFSAQDLTRGKAKGLALIQAGIPAAETNLIKALRGLSPGIRPMPGGGPLLTDPEIAEIESWINEGCLPDPPVPPQIV
ncbi:hypothetical protein GGE50_003847 [Rhizobium leguminosarum]|uniref:hypothetical protein n=1 Tax=Rhizobium leguminosarum TaxID=384 RepID=UPI00161AF341|nr:hypothetical protein [Rhizobium leguminosarum]MBB4587943.1 hypothetical protein [Rhizobium leguminosarum]